MPSGNEKLWLYSVVRLPLTEVEEYWWCSIFSVVNGDLRHLLSYNELLSNLTTGGLLELAVLLCLRMHFGGPPEEEVTKSKRQNLVNRSN